MAAADHFKGGGGCTSSIINEGKDSSPSFTIKGFSSPSAREKVSSIHFTTLEDLIERGETFKERLQCN